MENIAALINLLCPSLISLGILRRQMKTEKWSMNDLIAYGTFLVLNLFFSQVVNLTVETFTDKKILFDSVDYTAVALIISVLLAYGRVIVVKVFHGSVEVEKK